MAPLRGLTLAGLLLLAAAMILVAGCWSGGSAAPGVATTEATSTGYSKPKTPQTFDPLFVDWPTPKLALLLTGEQDGYLEPCGCAGLDRQKGGLGRRHALLEELRGKGWPLVALDVGGLTRRFGVQAETKYKLGVEALATLGYSALGFGPRDLNHSTGTLLGTIAELSGKPLRFVSANVSIADYASEECVPFLVIEEGGRKVGVTAALAPEHAAALGETDVAVRDAEEAVADVLPQLEGCDVKVLLAFAPLETSRRWAEKFDGAFDVVVTAGGAEEPPDKPLAIGSRTWLVEVGHKGMYAAVVAFTYDAARPRLFQRVPLDARFKETAAMKDLMRRYQSELETIGLVGLEIRTAPHPRGEFAGSASCRECHPTAFGVWSGSKHAHATESLTALDPARHFDPECLSCHVTGWEPQKYYPFASGFVSLESTPALVGNGCENCHGPAAAHVAAERGRDRAERETRRAGLRLTEATAGAACAPCHDLDNSPDFDFATYWPKVKHKGKK